MQVEASFVQLVLVAIVVAVGAILLATVLGVRSFRRPLDESSYRTAQWETRLTGLLAALAIVLLGVAVISFVVWFLGGLFHGMG